MKTRSFEKAIWFVMAMLVAVALVVFGGVYRAMAAPEDVPLAARRTVAWNTAGITADTNTSSSLTQAYAYHDVFCSVAIHSAGGVTITIASSPADSTFYDTHELAQITSDTDVFTRVISYGLYERLEFDVNDTGLITPTCTSIFFNDWYPSGYAEQKEE